MSLDAGKGQEVGLGRLALICSHFDMKSRVRYNFSLEKNRVGLIMQLMYDDMQAITVAVTQSLCLFTIFHFISVHICISTCIIQIRIKTSEKSWGLLQLMPTGCPLSALLLCSLLLYMKWLAIGI